MTGLLRLAALLAAFLLLRWLWLWFWRRGWKHLVHYALRKVNQPAASPSRQGTVKRDPVCGTFVDIEVAVRQVEDGRILYFCSERCREAHRLGQPAGAATPRAG